MPSAKASPTNVLSVSLKNRCASDRPRRPVAAVAPLPAHSATLHTHPVLPRRNCATPLLLRKTRPLAHLRAGLPQVRVWFKQKMRVLHSEGW